MARLDPNEVAKLLGKVKKDIDNMQNRDYSYYMNQWINNKHEILTYHNKLKKVYIASDKSEMSHQELMEVLIKNITKKKYPPELQNELIGVTNAFFRENGFDFKLLSVYKDTIESRPANRGNITENSNNQNNEQPNNLQKLVDHQPIKNMHTKKNTPVNMWGKHKNKY